VNGVDINKRAAPVFPIPRGPVPRLDSRPLVFFFFVFCPGGELLCFFFQGPFGSPGPVPVAKIFFFFFSEAKPDLKKKIPFWPARAEGPPLTLPPLGPAFVCPPRKKVFFFSFFSSPAGKNRPLKPETEPEPAGKTRLFARAFFAEKTKRQSLPEGGEFENLTQE